MQQIKIDLKNPSTDKVNVELQWNVKVLEPKRGFLSGIFRPHNRIDRQVGISITDIKVPNEVVCDRNNLFSILYDGKEFEQSEFPVSARVTDMSMPFQLLFHQGEIKDCTHPQDANPRSYPISFTVNLLDVDDPKEVKVIDSVQHKINVVFQPLGAKAQYKIYVEKDKVQYASTLGKLQVGTLAIWLDEEFGFTPDQLASVNVQLFQGSEAVNGIVSLSEGDCKRERNNICIRPGRDNVVRTPIFVDFTTVSNPLAEKETYTIQTSIVLSAAYSPEVKETILEQAQFDLLKDLQGTELKVFLETDPGDGQTKRELCDGSRALAIPLNFVPRSRLTKSATVILSNMATNKSNRRAGLHIKNLTVSELLLDDVTVIGVDNKIITQFVDIDGARMADMSSSKGLFIPNGPDAKTELEITFDTTKIADLLRSQDYNFRVQTVLTFDYWEDKDGTGILDEDSKRTGRVPITWQLHLEPNDEWLCVDYGSSAIVCRYDKDILDLKGQKDLIFSRDKQFRKDTIETGTPFLSSDIVLHNVAANDKSSLCSQQAANEDVPYLNLAVCLSPTSSLMESEIRTLLPCLKILVGNEFLPQTLDYSNFTYTWKCENSSSLKTGSASEAKNDDEPSCILRISSIFNEAYAELFRYFISPVSKDKNINKLVLTFPNTYTPAQLKVLEGIVRSTFPKVRDGYLRFVSESDAVAAYYLDNWYSFNEGGLLKYNSDETVLVYDMGAGTLDITLFRKSVNPNGKVVVDILGKIGTGKAGNYLDFIISKIISRNVCHADGTPIVNDHLVSTDSPYDNNERLQRFQLKDEVKNKVKRDLKSNKEITCKLPLFGCPSIAFNTSVIFEDPDFQSYLSEVTSGIIRQLLTSIGDPNMKIDTVLMSGRSCRLGALQNALKAALGTSVHMVKFDGNGENKDKSKTVVAEGAMLRAGKFSSPESPVVIRSRRLFASYGLLYKAEGGKIRYVELLNHSKIPFVEGHEAFDDFYGDSVAATGTASADKIKLVQTYLSPQATQEAYSKGDLEFISEMEEYSMVDFGGKNSLNVKLKLDHKNNVSLFVNGKKTMGSSPKGVDLASEITKRSIWPVTI